MKPGEVSINFSSLLCTSGGYWLQHHRKRENECYGALHLQGGVRITFSTNIQVRCTCSLRWMRIYILAGVSWTLVIILICESVAVYS